MRILKYALSFTLLAAMAVTASAQNYFNSRSLANKLKKGTTPECKIVAVDNSEFLLHTADSIAALSDNNRPNIMFLPVVFTSYKMMQPMALEQPDTVASLTKHEMPTIEIDNEWIENLSWRNRFENEHLQRLAVESPWLVPYNLSMLPEPPKQYEAKLDVKKNILTIEVRKLEVPEAAPEHNLKRKNWIHAFDATLQFSQAYMTDNWYQGGEKNINLLAHLWYNLKLNQTLHPRLLFDLTTQYKLGVNSAPADELRGYNINEDLFQLNMQFGIKATKRFYYSMNMQFKTQMLQNFQTNTWKMKASLLTPGELNAGVGMAYSTKNKRGNVTFDASLSPLSYNMKMWRANYKLLDDNGEMLHPDKLEHQVGSSGEVKFGWAMTRNISLSSRIFAFSDYSYLQGDWETTLSFSINKFLSTQIYAHVRFDDSQKITDSNNSHWQFKEVFSFGLQYKFR